MHFLFAFALMTLCVLCFLNTYIKDPLVSRYERVKYRCSPSRYSELKASRNDFLTQELAQTYDIVQEVQTLKQKIYQLTKAPSTSLDSGERETLSLYRKQLRQLRDQAHKRLDLIEKSQPSTLALA